MAKTASWIFGVIFIIVGVWGFFTQNVLGFIAADAWSSIIHIIVGVVLLVLASKPSAGTALKSVGIIYVIFAILGFWQSTTVLFGVFTTNATTNWFYLIVGVIIAVLGFTGKTGSSVMPPAPTTPAPQM
jgi:hypothetical protein